MLKYRLNSKTYIRLNIYQQENIILSYFHSSNFYNIPNHERIILLKELERIEAKKQKRQPFDVTEFNPKEMLLDAGVLYNKSKIYFNKYTLQEGVSQILTEDGSTVYSPVPHLNLFLLDCILHEQFHIITLKNLESQLAYQCKELKEYLIYLSNTTIEELSNQQNNVKNHYYRYITNPYEFYAFQYAQENTLAIIEQLQKKYGEEKNINLYLEEINRTKKKAINSYRNEFGITIHFDDLWEKLMNNEILNFSQIHNLDYQELKQEINNSKKLTHKFKIKRD